MAQFVADTAVESDSMLTARTEAAELGITAPDPATIETIGFLAAHSGPQRSAIIVSPAACVVGQAILSGFGTPGNGHVTCIDTESEHQQLARRSFLAAGHKHGDFRLLPSRPLEVMTRLATGAYGFIFAEVHPTDMETLIDEALPLLAPGGMLVVSGALLDGTVVDETRTDRDTEAARALDASLHERNDIRFMRLPVGSGLLVISPIADGNPHPES